MRSVADAPTATTEAPAGYLLDLRVSQAWTALEQAVHDCHPSLRGLVGEMRLHYAERLDTQRRTLSAVPR